MHYLARPIALSFLAGVLCLSNLAAIPTDGLTAYWSFNQDFTNSALASGNQTPSDPSHLDLLTTGNTQIDSEGLVGSAASFDGVGDFLEIGGGPLNQRKVVEDDPFGGATISVWFKVDSAPSGSTRFMIFETSPTYALSLGLREDPDDTTLTRIQAFTETTSAGFLNVVIPIPDSVLVGNWVHAVITLSDTGLTLHAQATTETVALIGNVRPFDDFHIGTYRDADNRFLDGLIDELAIWDRVLSAGEIEDLAVPNVVVDTDADEDNGSLSGGAGLSLREAVNYAPANARITFAPSLSGATIRLTLGELNLPFSADGLAIDASDLSNGITLNAGGNSRILQIGIGANVSFRGLTFRGGNAGNQPGGAIYSGADSLHVTDCSFQGNRADDGGAIYNLFASATLINCAFQGNHAQDDGGAVHNSSSPASLINCSFQGNRAEGNGGAMFNAASPVTLTNCIVWNNAEGGTDSLSPGASVANSSSNPSYFHCLVQNIDLSGSNNNLDGSEPLNAPHFVAEVDPLAAPAIGGDLRLAFGSPALDAGDNHANDTSTDLAGNSRVSGIIVDLGAYESQGSLFVSQSSGNSDSANTGSNWSDAFLTLQKALDVAVPGQGIYVSRGIYYPDEGPGQTSGDRSATFALPDGIFILAGFSSFDNTLFDQRDVARFETVLSGEIQQDADSSNNAYHVLTADGTDALARLDGFTITGGNANGSSDNSGGGLYSSNQASPTLANCVFQDNSALFSGGAVYNNASSSTFINCSFQRNNAQFGGAVDANFLPSPTFIHCAFQENSAQNDGGAIYISDCSPTLTDCSFQENSAQRQGGAILSIFSSFILTNGSFLGNDAQDNGGAIANEQSPSPRLTNCLFLGNNSRSFGGAIYNIRSSPIVTNCSIQGNNASIAGGAMANDLNSFPAIENSILWNNSGNQITTTPEASVANYSAAAPTFKNSLVQNWSTADLGGSGNLDGTDPANDPRFVSEVDPLSAPMAIGGDLRLLLGSPAIDAGDGSLNDSSNELLGHARIHNNIIDLGTYESQGSLFVRQSSGDDGNAGTDWFLAFATLQKALDVAVPGQGIYVAAGTYYPDEGPGQISGDRTATFALKSSVLIYGGFPDSGTPTLANRDPATHETILSGDLDQNDGANFASNDNNAYQVVTADATDAFARLDGFTITGGHADRNVALNGGGGLRCENSSSPTLSNCSIRGNFATSGGGIFIQNSSLTLFRSTVAYNHASQEGGGIYSNTNLDEQTLRIIRSTLANNRADAEGGAVFNLDGLTELISSTVTGNTAPLGAGIGSYDDDATRTRLSGTLVRDNNGGSDLELLEEEDDDINSFVSSGSNLVGSLGPNVSGFAPSEIDTTPVLLAPLGNYGGPTATMPPLPGSPAIDATSGTFSNEDQRGLPILATADIGAAESQGKDDLGRFWDFDWDGDGNAFGVEHALGTDPLLADSGAPGNLSITFIINQFLTTEISFGLNQDALDYTIWRLKRSPDLSPGSFETIYSFEGPDREENYKNVTSPFTPEPDVNELAIQDPEGLADKAFYIFEAQFVP